MARYLETQGTTTTTLTELFSAHYMNTMLGQVWLVDDCDARDPVREVKTVPAAPRYAKRRLQSLTTCTPRGRSIVLTNALRT